MTFGICLKMKWSQTVKAILDPDPLLLIDADVPLYQACFSAEHDWQWTEEIHSLNADINVAEEVFERYIRSIVIEFPSVFTPILCFSGSDNFRTEIYPKYKSNRKDKRKPLLLDELRQLMMSKYLSIRHQNLEADDVLGLMSASGVMVSIDKDLRTVPGLLYNPNKPEDGILIIEEPEADYNHLYQTLVGDSTDGYSGCPSIGPARASKILDEDCSWDAVTFAYERKDLTADYALTQAHMARILRPGEYNFAQRKPILWQPPNLHEI